MDECRFLYKVDSSMATDLWRKLHTNVFKHCLGSFVNYRKISGYQTSPRLQACDDKIVFPIFHLTGGWLFIVVHWFMQQAKAELSSSRRQGKEVQEKGIIVSVTPFWWPVGFLQLEHWLFWGFQSMLCRKRIPFHLCVELRCRVVSGRWGRYW